MTLMRAASFGAAAGALFATPQSAVSAAFATTGAKSVTLPSTPSAGDLVVVAIGTNSATTNTVAATGASWTRAVQDAHNPGTEIWWSVNVTTNSVTVTPGGSRGSFAVIYAANGNAAPQDQTNHTFVASGAGTTLATGSITPTQDGELVVAVFCAASGSPSGSPAGYTMLAVVTDTLANVRVGYVLQTTAAATNPSQTIANFGGSAAIASFTHA